MLSLYATGGRGFHVEIPPEVFLAKLPKAGTARLPAIYKEMAYEVFVDTLDLRVYSGRKGRMWRTPGVQRENGRYKVPITLDEANHMTPENYLALTAGPREECIGSTYVDSAANRHEPRPMPAAPKASRCKNDG